MFTSGSYTHDVIIKLLSFVLIIPNVIISKIYLMIFHGVTQLADMSCKYYTHVTCIFGEDCLNIKCVTKSLPVWYF